MTKTSYKFFTNKECDYYPCHRLEEINCLFCYCPLFQTNKCINTNKKYDCINCDFPHRPENYELLLGLMTPKNCWEALDCPSGIRKRCDVYKEKAGAECWKIKSEFKKHGKTLTGCKKCRWYIMRHQTN